MIHTFIKLGARLFLNMDRFIEYVLDLTFYIKVKRFQYYPVMTLVVPCVMTAMLIVLTFILPPDAGEKVGLSKLPSKRTKLDSNIFLDITILLAMVVFMDQLAQQTPPMPSKLPVIGQVNDLFQISSRNTST